LDRLTKIFVILAASGIPDAFYHAYDEITSYSAPGSSCNINVLVSCTRVFQSGHTKFLGVSLWVYGVAWFPLILAMGMWFGSRGGLNGTYVLPTLMVGNLFTLYLWYLELDVIHAICPVCVSLYVLNYAMTVTAFAIALRDGWTSTTKEVRARTRSEIT
jgi:uncharacterized membrane protein